MAHLMARRKRQGNAGISQSLKGIFPWPWDFPTKLHLLQVYNIPPQCHPRELWSTIPQTNLRIITTYRWGNPCSQGSEQLVQAPSVPDTSPDPFQSTTVPVLGEAQMWASWDHLCLPQQLLQLDPWQLSFPCSEIVAAWFKMNIPKSNMVS